MRRFCTRIITLSEFHGHIVVSVAKGLALHLLDPHGDFDARIQLQPATFSSIGAPGDHMKYKTKTTEDKAKFVWMTIFVW